MLKSRSYWQADSRRKMWQMPFRRFTHMPWMSQAVSSPHRVSKTIRKLLHSLQQHGVGNLTAKGRYGKYGGQYVSETLMSALIELEDAYGRACRDHKFSSNLRALQTEYAGRETPLTFCPNASRELGCKIYLKREDLVHGGSHKLNNTLGQALLAKKMGKKRLIAETSAGQHGVATAIVVCRARDTRRSIYGRDRHTATGAQRLPYGAHGG